MQGYLDLVNDILNNGVQSDDRTGVGTRKLFGTTLSMDLRAGFPALTVRDINYKAAFGELAAFIQGATTTKQFRDNGCNYWNQFGEELGPIYGSQWRNWGSQGFDQLRSMVETLRETPWSRRMLMSTWNVSDLENMRLPPCHIINQYDVESSYDIIGNNVTYLDSIVYMRSVDVMLGLPYDIIIYALLQHLIALELGYEPRYLGFMMGNTHIYNNHINKAIELTKVKPKTAPELVLYNNVSLFDFKPDQADLIFYNPNPKVEFDLNV